MAACLFELIEEGKCIYGSFSQIIFYIITVHFLRAKKWMTPPFLSHYSLKHSIEPDTSQLSGFAYEF
jgi:hypothetical protein